MKYTLLAAAAAIFTLAPVVDGNSGRLFGVGVASAQQMGSQPWGFSGRSRSLAAQFQFQRDLVNGSGAADGMAALQQYITQYNSSSTSIGNLNEVTQVLSGGSTGSVGQTTDQTSQGNQGSSATTDTTVTNTAVSVEGDVNPAQDAAAQSQTASQPQNGEQPAAQ
jgi:hypothetical protein